MEFTNEKSDSKKNRKECNTINSIKSISINQNIKFDSINNISTTEPSNEKSINDLYNYLIDYVVETNKKIQKNIKEIQDIETLLENYHNSDDYKSINKNKKENNYKEINKQNKEMIIKSINKISEERMRNYKNIFHKMTKELDKIQDINMKTHRIENIKNNNILYPRVIFDRKKLFKRQHTPIELERLKKQYSFQRNLIKKRYSLSFHCSKMKKRKYSPLLTNNSLNKKIYLRNDKLTPLQVYTTSSLTKQKTIKKIKRPISSSPYFLTEKFLSKTKNYSSFGYITRIRNNSKKNVIPYKTEINTKYKINEALIKKSLSNRGSFNRKQNL